MKLQLLFVFAALLLSVCAVPAQKQIHFASTKDLGATLVRVPAARFKGGGGCGNPTSAPTTTTSAPSTTGSVPTASTSAPSTTSSAPRTTKSSGGTTPSGGGVPSGTGSCESCSADNFDLVNNYRASNGLNRLGWSDTLGDLAAQWSQQMYDTRVFQHSDYPYWENIAWGYNVYTWDSVADGMFEGWKNSPGHDQNMRLPSHKCMGVGIYGDGSRFYGTQIFSNDCP